MSTIYSTMVVMHWFAALVLVMHAVNKIEQYARQREGLCTSECIPFLAKALAWMVISLAACGVLVAPALRQVPVSEALQIWINPVPSISECGVYIGMAAQVLIKWGIVIADEAKARKAAAASASQHSDIPAGGHGAQP